jgi:hypothetical protein
MALPVVALKFAGALATFAGTMNVLLAVPYEVTPLTVYIGVTRTS